MERIKEKQIDRSKCADRATGDKKKTCVERVFVPVDLTGKPNGSQRDDRGQQHHDHAQAVQPRRETQVLFGRQAQRSDVLKIMLRSLKGSEEKQCERER